MTRNNDLCYYALTVAIGQKSMLSFNIPVVSCYVLHLPERTSILLPYVICTGSIMFGL